MFPWLYTQQQALTPQEMLLRRLREGVPKELALRAAGMTWDEVKEDPEIDRALAEGEILLFERARDSGVTGVVRAAMRYESSSWNVKAEASQGQSLEDLLRE